MWCSKNVPTVRQTFSDYLQVDASGTLLDVVQIQASKHSYKGDIITTKQTKDQEH